MAKIFDFDFFEILNFFLQSSEIFFRFVRFAYRQELSERRHNRQKRPFRNLSRDYSRNFLEKFQNQGQLQTEEGSCCHEFYHLLGGGTSFFSFEPRTMDS